jgi:hypothetical protein
MKWVAFGTSSLVSIGIGWEVTQLVAGVPRIQLGTAEDIGALVAFSLIFIAAVAIFGE